MTIKTIHDFPFQLFTAEVYSDKEATIEFFKKHNLTASLLSQLYAYLATLTKFTKTSDGKIDSSRWIKDNIPKDPWHIGLFYAWTYDPRGSLLGRNKQKDPSFINYSALVPIVLGAHKQLNDIPYQNWSQEGLKSLVHKSLYEAMTCNAPNFSKEELLQIRNAGLTARSGKTAGSVKEPTSAYGLLGLKDRGIPEEFIALPKLAQIMLTQIWVAHPTLRTELMVLSPNNWDEVPEPLETSEIFSASGDW